MPLATLDLSWGTNFRGGKEKNMDKSKVYMKILICSTNNTSTMTFMLHSYMHRGSTAMRLKFKVILFSTLRHATYAHLEVCKQ